MQQTEQVADIDLTTMDEETAKLYKLYGRPKFKLAFPVAIQHLLAMFTGNLAPILIISAVAQASITQTTMMVQAAMFAAGISTLINLYPIKIGKWQIGANLPIVMGTAMTFVPPATLVATRAIEMGMPNPIGVVVGAIMVAAFAEAIVGVFYKYLRPFFPPLVIGSVLISLGISLFTVGVNNFGGGSPATNPNFGSGLNMAVAFGVFFINMFLQRFGTGMWKISSILIAMTIGYIAAALLGMVNFDPLYYASVFAFPQPLYLRPEFHGWAIGSFIAIFVVSGLSTIGYTQSITNQAMGREATNKEISGAIFADAVASSFSAIFNSLPNTEFGQNAGIVAFTKIINKWCIALCAIVLIASSMFPIFGAVFAAIPPSVLGGAILSIFAMIFTNGVILISRSGFSAKNITMLTIIFGIGLGFAPPNNAALIQSFPSWLQFVFSDRVLLISVVAVLVNLFFMTAEDFANQRKEHAKKED